MKKVNFKNKPYLLGITGNFGTGKSTAGKILKSKNVCVIDTDDIVKDILSSKNKTTSKLIKVFGKTVINNDSSVASYINKKCLAKLVFNDPVKRQKLELIIHPEVFKRLKKLRLSKKKYKIIAELVPLLFECNWEENYDEIWCITCSKNIQLKRLLKKGISSKDAMLRIKTQMSQKKKSKLADHIIDNSGSIADTKKRISTRLKLITRVKS